MTMVVLKNDLDTFCKYVAMRPPNVDQRAAINILWGDDMQTAFLVDFPAGGLLGMLTGIDVAAED